jgi:hypothetical protein
MLLREAFELKPAFGIDMQTSMSEKDLRTESTYRPLPGKSSTRELRHVFVSWQIYASWQTYASMQKHEHPTLLFQLHLFHHAD